MHIPAATYRVQLTPFVTFRAAQEIVPYLADLGLSDLYASPVFRTRKGSLHGYDVVDPCQLNPELGTEEEFAALIRFLKQHGLSWLQDIVPNHMAFDTENAMLMDLLEKGKHSRYAAFFDIDWDHPYESIKGRLLAPFLGKFYAECLEHGEIRLQYDETGFSINYYVLRFPLKIESYPQVLEHNIAALEARLGSTSSEFTSFLGLLHLLKGVTAAPGANAQYDQVAHAKTMLWNLYTAYPEIKRFIDDNVAFFNGKKGDPASFNNLDRLISEQLFRLSFWKVAAEEINYRRFFTVNELISLKTEDPAVFEEIHRLVFSLVKRGMIEGLRVDHIDGLYDPTEYLRRLKKHLPGTYVVVEKILANGERLPDRWPVEGTTGYDFMNRVNNLFCQASHEKECTAIYQKFASFDTSYADLVSDKKRLIIGKHLAGNIDNLAQMMKRLSSRDRHGRDLTLYGIKRALVEVMAFFPVYRTYLNAGGAVRKADREYAKEAIAKARESVPGLRYELDFIEKFLSLRYGESLPEEVLSEWRHFVMSWQQYTAPLMAKGFEDTILYIYNRLISLNEVGGYPEVFGISVEDFHDFNKTRCADSPHTFNTTSTHDAKRGEDVRARINVISELPDEWRRRLKLWSGMNAPKKRRVDGSFAPDANDEYFIYQTLLGAFPFDRGGLPSFAKRMKKYIVKAVREAKVHTAWIKPDTDYEQACVSFVEELLAHPGRSRFMKSFLPFQRTVAHYGVFNSLSQLLLKIASPGVPDFYQGTELWDLNLVDPDNRRRVDFKARQSALRDIRERYEKDPLRCVARLLASREDGRVKLFLTHRALAARKEREALFSEGTYIPLNVSGKFRQHIVAFARTHQGAWALTVAPRLVASVVTATQDPLGRKAWENTRITLPAGAPTQWTDAVTSQKIACGKSIPAAKALAHFPAALLIGE